MNFNKIKKFFRTQNKVYSFSNYLRWVHARHKQVIFSGIQPTGVPHLGNYFGALRNWALLESENKSCIFSIVDLHSITLPQNPIQLRKNIQLMAACLIACGINTENSTLFVQSQVPYHTELSWILGCLTTMARLTHLPQYKEKSGVSTENVPLGLFMYPILQSADILMYKATDVPVGEDQLQHIQLSQHLVKLFNNRYGDVFPTPNPLVVPNCARIKSLRDPSKKMSKSDPDLKSRIELTDHPDTIVKRIKGALTDFTSNVTFEPDSRPGVSNLILIHSLCSGKTPEKICEESCHLDTGKYKLLVAEILVEFLKPIRLRVEELVADSLYIREVLEKGAEKADKVAFGTISEVKHLMGLPTRK